MADRKEQENVPGLDGDRLAGFGNGGAQLRKMVCKEGRGLKDEFWCRCAMGNTRSHPEHDG